ncbi:hypothetical protein ABPG74_022294 [Tetrahymena malaccensis]
MEKYTKIKVVGKGSFGYAVLVQSNTENNKKYYVIKIIDISKMDRKQREEALNEVHVLKAMKHPYIITYRESFIEKRCLCIIMEYAQGGDLYTKIAKQKEKGQLFSEKQIIDWFVQMALAIKHVHDRKILHRDLKTQNIFLNAKGDIKIGDFGIARVLQHTYDCAKTAIGTPYYLSPEICQEKPYNQKSDIWSLGCILYEMTTLNHAFDANSMKGLVLKILRGTYPPIPEQYSQDLRDLISEMLIKDPTQRPSIRKILEKDFLKNRISELFSNTLQRNDPQSGAQILEIRNPADQISQQNDQQELEKQKEQQINENFKKLDQNPKVELPQQKPTSSLLKKDGQTDSSSQFAKPVPMQQQPSLQSFQQQQQSQIQLQQQQQQSQINSGLFQAGSQFSSKNPSQQSSQSQLTLLQKSQLQQQQQQQQKQQQQQQSITKSPMDSIQKSQILPQQSYFINKSPLRGQYSSQQQNSINNSNNNSFNKENFNRGSSPYRQFGMNNQVQSQDNTNNSINTSNSYLTMLNKINSQQPSQIQSKENSIISKPGSQNLINENLKYITDKYKEGQNQTPSSSIPNSNNSSIIKEALKVNNNVTNISVNNVIAQSDNTSSSNILNKIEKKSLLPQSGSQLAIKPTLSPFGTNNNSAISSNQISKKSSQVNIAAPNMVNGNQKGGDDDDETLEEQGYGYLLQSIQDCLANKPQNSKQKDEEEENFGDQQFQIFPKFLKIDGKPFIVPGISNKDTTGSKIEALRYYLEKQIGADQFMEVYRLIIENQVNDDNKQITRLIGEVKVQFLPLIYQLIVCEESYYYGN